VLRDPQRNKMKNKKKPERLKTAFLVGGCLAIADPIRVFVGGEGQPGVSASWLIGIFTQFVIGGLCLHYLLVVLKKLFQSLKGRNQA